MCSWRLEISYWQGYETDSATVKRQLTQYDIRKRTF